MSKENHITLELEGTSEDEGHVRLSDLLDRLKSLQASINSIHRSLSGSKVTNLYYRVVSASHSSPLSISVEPVDVYEGPNSNSVVLAHDRFFEELGKLESGAAPSADMDNEAVESLGRFVKVENSRFSKIVVKNNSSQVELSDQAQRTVDEYLLDETWTIGSLTGMLDTVDFHRKSKKKFFIYPVTGPSKIECVFKESEEIKELVKSSIECRVRVFGKKHYRKNQSFPHSINVDSIEVVSKSDGPSLLDLAGTLDTEEGSVEIIDKIRNDW